MKEIKSTIGWKIIAYMVVMTGAFCGSLFLLWFSTFREDDSTPLAVYVSFCVIGSIALMLLLHFFTQTKKITITDEGFSMQYRFRNEFLTYKNDQLLGFREHYYRYHSYLYFKTSDGKTFMFNNSEFMNFNRLKMAMMAKSNPIEIGLYFQGRILLTLFAVASAIVWGIAFTHKCISTL